MLKNAILKSGLKNKRKEKKLINMSFCRFIRTNSTILATASYSKLSKELKNGIAILVSQAVFKFWIQTSKYCFDR